MGVVGENFKNGVIFVPEMLVAARAMKKGVYVPAQKFVDTYRENPDTKIIALSALLTTTMPALRDAVTLLNQHDFRKDIKVMVGGVPISQAFADEMGADAYTALEEIGAIECKDRLDGLISVGMLRMFY